MTEIRVDPYELREVYERLDADRNIFFCCKCQCPLIPHCRWSGPFTTGRKAGYHCYSCAAGMKNKVDHFMSFIQTKSKTVCKCPDCDMYVKLCYLDDHLNRWCQKRCCPGHCYLPSPCSWTGVASQLKDHVCRCRTAKIHCLLNYGRQTKEKLTVDELLE